MKKICVCIGYKSDYTWVRSVLEAVQSHPELELQLCVNSVHGFIWYDDFLNSITEDGFKIDYVINSIVGTRTMTSMGQSIALGIIQYQTALYSLRPDILLVVGDRFETLSPTLAAAFHNIPIAHIGGGERSGTIDEPTRHAISKYANLHFVANMDASKRLIAMGEDPCTVFITGSPVVDLLKRVNLRAFHDEGDYLLVMQHPVTTESRDAKQQMTETLEAIKQVGMRTYLWYPNIDGGASFMIQAIDEFLEKNNNIITFNHMIYELYLGMLYYCSCFITNSSSGIRESCYFGVPTLNLGTRQQHRLKGKNVMDVPHDRKEIERAINWTITMPRFEPEELYGDGHAGERIAGILAKTEIKNTQKCLTY